MNFLPVHRLLRSVRLPRREMAGLRQLGEEEERIVGGMQGLPLHLVLGLLCPQFLLSGDLLLLRELQHLGQPATRLWFTSARPEPPAPLQVSARHGRSDSTHAHAFFAFGLLSMSRRAFAAFSRASGSSAVAFAPCGEARRSSENESGAAHRFRGASRTAS